MIDYSFSKPREKGFQTILLIIVVLFLVLGVAAFLIFSPEDSETNEVSITEPEQTESQTEDLPLPEKDVVASKDIEGIERYPGSVIVNYNKNEEGGTSVEYATKASLRDVKEYFVQELQEQSWEVVSTSKDDLKLEKDPATLFVELYEKNSNRNAQYILRYSPESNY